MTLVRKATNRLLELVNDGEMDPMMALQMCLDWLTEDEVAEMMDANNLLETDDDMADIE
jgi:hypothetical protein